MMRGTHGVPHPLPVTSNIQDVNADPPYAQTKKVDVDFVYGVFGAPIIIGAMSIMLSY